uniref:SKIP_SNW domain-containing protein n=1 Tax=Anisakis simplex TaxID=6269 RepID=A0A0M3KHM3_ANISI
LKFTRHENKYLTLGRAAIQRQRSRGADILLSETIASSAPAPPPSTAVELPIKGPYKIRRKGQPTITVNADGTPVTQTASTENSNPNTAARKTAGTDDLLARLNEL